MNQKEIDSLIRHQTYIDRFGSGLANRTLELFDNNDLLNLVISKRGYKKKIQDLLAKDRKAAKKFVLKEVRQMAMLELSFVNQLSVDFKDIKISKARMNELVDIALEKPLIVTNNSPVDLYDSAFNKKEQISVSLDSMNSLEIKDISLIEAEMMNLFSQFANAMQVANKTFSFAVSNEIRETAYSKSKAIDRVVMSAILDGRTTPFCMNIDGEIFKKGEGARPPFHPRCRTIGIPVIVGQTDEEINSMLSYRPQIEPGTNYEKGDSKDLRSTRKQTEEGKSKVKPFGEKANSSSNYANFLSSQTKTPEGIQFIQDRLGIKKGNYFIQEIKKGADPKKLLKSTLFDMKAKDITLDDLKKKIKKSSGGSGSGAPLITGIEKLNESQQKALINGINRTSLIYDKDTINTVHIDKKAQFSARYNMDNSITVNPKYFTDENVKIQNKRQRKRKEKTDKNIKRDEEYLSFLKEQQSTSRIRSEIRVIENSLESLKTMQSKRFSVGDSLEDVVVHETGHAINGNLAFSLHENISDFLPPSEMRKKGFNYKNSLSSKLDYIARTEGIKISKYATHNDGEYFAESWLLFEKDRKQAIKVIDKDLLKIFEEITK